MTNMSTALGLQDNFKYGLFFSDVIHEQCMRSTHAAFLEILCLQGLNVWNSAAAPTYFEVCVANFSV